jgi:succinate-acetate transporter protein
MAQYAERAEAAAPAVANPAPLGLSAFALTTLVLSAANANLFSAADAGIVVGLALFYGGLGQLLAGMWEFRSGNTFGAVAFSSYGGFWLAVGWDLQNKLLPLGTAAAGYFLLGWAIFTFLMLLGTFRQNLAVLGVFLFLTLTFLALAIGAFAGSGGATWNQIGGWLGIITALLAWYTALAGVLVSTKSPFQLPTFPMG